MPKVSVRFPFIKYDEWSNIFWSSTGRQGNKVQKEQTGSSTNSNASSPRDKQAAGKEMDPNHWSNDEKYDVETILDSSYRKHLARDANK